MDGEYRKPLPPPRREESLKPLPQQDREMPEWVQEYAGPLVIGAIIMFGLGPFMIFKNMTAAPKGPDPNAMARLQIIYGPVRQYAEGSNTKVESLRVTVRNLGPAQATGVRVAARLFNQDYTLSGLETIQAGRSIDYEGPIGVHLSLKDTVSVSTRCDNCP